MYETSRVAIGETVEQKASSMCIKSTTQFTSYRPLPDMFDDFDIIVQISADRGQYQWRWYHV